MSIIEVEALVKTFKTRERTAGLSGSLCTFIAPHYRLREAVKPISFSLEPGELLAFIGPSRIEYEEFKFTW
jgi:ABC-2 type transport system ATP-binding protein